MEELQEFDSDRGDPVRIQERLKPPALISEGSDKAWSKQETSRSDCMRDPDMIKLAGKQTNKQEKEPSCGYKNTVPS